MFLKKAIKSDSTVEKRLIRTIIKRNIVIFKDKPGFFKPFHLFNQLVIALFFCTF